MSKRPLWIRCVGAVLCGLAFGIALLPILRYASVAMSDDEVRLDGSAQHVTLPAEKTWGVYIDDADNSGYSMSCSAVDENGRQIQLRDPWWTMSGSDTEVLDFVFDTGSGDLTFTCSVPGEGVTLKPVPNLKAAVLGILEGAAVAALGLALLLNWSFNHRPPEPWAVGGPAYQPIPFPGEQPTWAPLPPKQRSPKKVAGIALGVVVLVVTLLLAVSAALNAAINRIGEEAFGDLPHADGDYYEVPGTADPALHAAGDKFLGEVDAPAGAVSDPFGSTCWVIGASLCMTSDQLDNRKLLEATTAQVRASGAELKKRWCFIDQCYAYLKYQGAPLMLLVDIPEKVGTGRAMVTGFVVGTEDPDVEPPAGAALGSWESLMAAPDSWKAPKCVDRGTDGCRKYEGTFAGAIADEKAVERARHSLQAGRYAITSDTCPEAGPVDVSCTIEARRFRTVGSRDGVVLSFHIRHGAAKGFEVDMTGEPYPA